MNTREIDNHLLGVESYIGTYARNRLPAVSMQRPLALVMNTDPDSKAGEHWITIYLNVDGTGDYFDSYGLPPLHREVYEFLCDNAPSGVSYNAVTLQNIFSTTCGGYCVLYIKARSGGVTHCEFINQFSRVNTVNNDKYVSNYIRMY